MKKRLFIALDLPKGFKKRLANLVKKLEKTKLPVRFQDPETYHITLRFLGYLDKTEEIKMKEVIDTSCREFTGFEIETTSLIFIPDSRMARVIAIDVLPNETMGKLQHAIVNELDKYPFIEVFTRKYKPHITIGRVKRGGLGFYRLDDMKSVVIKERIKINAVKLKESNIERTGARYRDIHVKKLKENDH